MKLLILGKKLSLYKIESKDLKILGLLDLLVIVGSRIEVPCAIRVLEVFKVFSYRFKDAKSNERGLTSGKCGELSLEGVFQNGGQNTLNLKLWRLKGSLNKVMSIRFYSS